MTRLRDAIAFWLVLSTASAVRAQDAVRGAAEFSRCRGCHAIAPGAKGFGPNLSGVYGRRAGALAGYSYSQSLRSAGFVWDDPHLERYLADPRSVGPDARMPLRVASPSDRADLIAYLKTLR